MTSLLVAVERSVRGWLGRVAFVAGVAACIACGDDDTSPPVTFGMDGSMLDAGDDRDASEEDGGDTSVEPGDDAGDAGSEDDAATADAAIVVMPTEGLLTTERGGEATFVVYLAAEPTADVFIGLDVDDPTEGAVRPARLWFTTLDWNAPQIVTVTGLDDTERDGDVTLSVITAPAESADPRYAGLDAPDVSVQNIDDETPAVIVTPTSGLRTTERGATAELTVALQTEPTADVVIGVASSDTTEGVVSPVSLTFTPINWNAPQTVTITGVDDPDLDGSITYRVLTAPAVSADPEYDGVDGPDATVVNGDDETPGVSFMPDVGLRTTEAGGTAQLEVTLDAPPTDDVVLDLSSGDPGEGTVAPARLTFTSLDWNAPQVVTLTGVDDDLLDGDQTWLVVTAPLTSTDPRYGGQDPPDLSVVNDDDETPGVTVTPTSGLVTTESGGTARLTVVLDAPPTADVAIDVSSSDTTEGVLDVSTVTFTPRDWNVPKPVVVTGVDDPLADGAQPYLVRTAPARSTDPRYAGLDGPNASVTNTDDDSPGVTITPTTMLRTTEEGGAVTFTIVLNSQPTADVVFNLDTSDDTEGIPTPLSVTFTRANWSAPRPIRVVGQDDDVADGDQRYGIVIEPAVSADPGYDGRFGRRIDITNVDDDTAGISVSPLMLTVSESGTTAIATVVLRSQPTADVTIAITSSDVLDGTVDPASMVFTETDWNMPRELVVTGTDDAIADGDQAFVIRLAPAVSTDPGYAGRDPPDVNVICTDDDVAGFIIMPTDVLLTSEAGGAAMFTIELTSEPRANVTVGLSSSDPTEGVVSPSSVTFTPTDWRDAQTVMVTGLPDDIDDDDVMYNVVTAPATSTDATYLGRNPPDVAVINSDDDTAGVGIEPTSGVLLSEPDTTEVISVALFSEPTANVTVTFTSTTPGAATVTPSSLVFTPATWTMVRMATIRATNDDIDDGDQPIDVTTTVTSTDLRYAGIAVADITGTTADDDEAGITVMPTTGLVTTEAGGMATFTVVLNSEPLSSVRIDLTSSAPTEGLPSPTSLTFTPSNWSMARTVMVIGQNDAVVDGDVDYSIDTAPAMSTDPIYSGMDASDVGVTNLDDD